MASAAAGAGTHRPHRPITLAALSYKLKCFASDLWGMYFTDTMIQNPHEFTTPSGYIIQLFLYEESNPFGCSRHISPHINMLPEKRMRLESSDCAQMLQEDTYS